MKQVLNMGPTRGKEHVADTCKTRYLLKHIFKMYVRNRCEMSGLSVRFVLFMFVKNKSLRWKSIERKLLSSCFFVFVVGNMCADSVE